MNRYHIWDNDDWSALAAMLVAADATIHIDTITEESLEGMWFDSTATPEQMKNACKIAFKDTRVMIYHNRVKIYDNYICDECGSRDTNKHSYMCIEIQPKSCYCHEDEI